MTNKVLYIDDNWFNCDLVRRILTHRGMEATTKTNAAEGIKFAIEHTPNLILVDIHMSPITGYECFSILRTIRSLDATPIVAITADTTSSTRNLCMTKGFDGFYGKPILRKELDEILQKYLLNRNTEVQESHTS
jgi:two-component system cell cycle response regulator DivK